ncbi:MAG: nucleoside/nucleotide kinase family protein [Phycisphaeraceae bacterium JB051]
MPLDVGEKQFPDIEQVVLGDDQLDDFANQLLADIAEQSMRKLIAIAGIPGSGKTTLMLKLIDCINAIEPATAAAVSMDAYHLMNVQLDALDLRKVKGSPQTYDVISYLHLLKQLKSQTQRDVFYPVYDRGIHNPIWRASQVVKPTVKILFTEGQFLLLDQSPWDELANVVDESWYLKVDPAKVREDLIARHVRGGRSRESAVEHVTRSDDANRDLVLTRMRKPDRVIGLPGR